jgi:hypothetical protein
VGNYLQSSVKCTIKLLVYSLCRLILPIGCISVPLHWPGQCVQQCLNAIVVEGSFLSGHTEKQVARGSVDLGGDPHVEYIYPHVEHV